MCTVRQIFPPQMRKVLPGFKKRPIFQGFLTGLSEWIIVVPVQQNRATAATKSFCRRNNTLLAPHRSQVFVEPRQGFLDVLCPGRNVVGVVEKQHFVFRRGSQEFQGRFG